MSEKNKYRDDYFAYEILLMKDRINQLECEVKELKQQLYTIQQKPSHSQPLQQQPQLLQQSQHVLKTKTIQLFREVKKEDIILGENLTKEYVMKQLEQTNPRTDFNFIKNIYFKDKPYGEYPIRYLNPKQMEYWCNNAWIIDHNKGNKIINILVSNIKASYKKVNIFENYKDTNDTFIDNQSYIHEMSKYKYKQTILKMLKEHLQTLLI